MLRLATGTLQLVGLLNEVKRHQQDPTSTRWGGLGNVLFELADTDLDKTTKDMVLDGPSA